LAIAMRSQIMLQVLKIERIYHEHQRRIFILQIFFSSVVDAITSVIDMCRHSEITREWVS
jgi:hypothetical protein